MVFAFEAARDVVGGEEKENGHERGILATEDSGGGMEGGLLGENAFFKSEKVLPIFTS